MRFIQKSLACLSHYSYLIADEDSQRAVVIDPQRDIDIYLDEAKLHGWQIDRVILTHFHADFVAGHIELQRRCQANIVLGAKAEAAYDFLPAKDGERFDYGSFSLAIMTTPGHTPESITVLVYDHSISRDAPWAALTGDTLFVGDVGRPDLLASIGVTADELADCLYDSVHKKLLSLPDATLVYPAHGAGSMCDKALGAESFTTIGQQRATNYALQPMSREEFKAIVTADQPEAPQYFVYDAILNRSERAILDERLAAMKPLDPAAFQSTRNDGARVVDSRSAEAFARGHVPGALHVSLDGRFASWAGTLVNPKERLLIVAEPGKERETAMRLGRIGYDNLVGFLDGGFAAWPAEAPKATIERIPADSAERRCAELEAVLLDVRKPAEWRAGSLPGTINIPLHELEARLAELDPKRPVVVHCQTGYRSSSACSILTGAGFTKVCDVIGGYKAWQGQPAAACTTSTCSTKAAN